MTRPIGITFIVFLSLIVIRASVQDSELSYGEHDLQADATRWVRIKLPEGRFYYEPTSTDTIRVKYSDGREFELLPTSQGLRQANGQTIQTKWIKLTKGKRIGVESPGEMPDRFLYLRAKQGTSSVHLSVTRPSDSTSTQTQRSEASGSNLLGWLVLGALSVLGCLLAYERVSKGIEEKCPRCSKLWAKQVKSSTELDRIHSYESVTRHDQHYNAYGEEIGTTAREESVPYTKVFYEDLNECKYCSHQWPTPRTDILSSIGYS
jgi:hypothetical protein